MSKRLGKSFISGTEPRLSRPYSVILLDDDDNDNNNNNNNNNHTAIKLSN
jgi:hypothetical protein